jgi:hypothetical protein
MIPKLFNHVMHVSQIYFVGITTSIVTLFKDGLFGRKQLQFPGGNQVSIPGIFFTKPRYTC